MLAMPCPACGSAVPLSLATPDRVVCPSCEHQGAPTPEVAQQLAEAQAALDECGAADRQLGRAQRSAVQWGLYSEIGYLVMVVLCLGPFVLMGLKSGLDALFYEGMMAATNWIMVVALLPVLLILGVVAFLGWALLRRARRKLERACCAVPPSKAGEPAGCHVCGGPLRSAGTQKVIRCGYCSADNLVEPAVLRRAGAKRKTVIKDYRREVQQQAVKVSGTLSRASIVFLVLVFVSPVLCGAPTLIVATMVWVTGLTGWAIVQTQQAASEDLHYGVVEVPEGRCICWIDPYEDENTVEFDPPLPSGTVVVVGDLEEIWTASQLIDLEVRVRETGEVGRVARTRRGLHIAASGKTYEGGARIHVDVGEPSDISVPASSVCLVVDE